ncbi:hypothetical protein [Tractidigestivibacter sp.]|uniref:hypothetical protein n=1 Tax=Tractidigestivibacter sp. TaxID=2847320 RepID=UPI002A911150|nr:hypothetical protein [Tractidigestivibacter sp.]MDY5271682.1 hypothetical protein [Tractidigestivibacter sp.]
MSDKVRAGRGMDDRDVMRKSSPLQRAARDATAGRAGTAETDRMGREQQRRATAYGRARGRL